MEFEPGNNFITNSNSLSTSRPSSDNTFKNLHTIGTLSKIISTMICQSRVPSRLHTKMPAMEELTLAAAERRKKQFGVGFFGCKTHGFLVSFVGSELSEYLMAS